MGAVFKKSQPKNCIFKSHLFSNKADRITMIKTRYISFFSVLLLFFHANTLVSAGIPALSLSGQRLVIRTSTFQNNGVLSCQPHPEDIKILDIIGKNNIISLKKYLHFLNKNIKYKSDDSTKNWVPWQDSLEKGYADCKGFSLLNRTFLRVLGYSPKIFILRGTFSAHAICVFHIHDKYIILDNSEFKPTPASSFEELTVYLAQKYDCNYIFEFDNNGVKS